MYITNVKVIAGEEIVKQHRLVVCDMKLKVEKKKKVKWVSKIKVWKLKEEKARQEYVQYGYMPYCKRKVDLYERSHGKGLRTSMR